MERVQVKDIHKGDILWEDSQYGSIQFEVLTEPKHVRGQWTWTARTYRDEEGEYLITDGYEHYGPRIVKTPGYFPQMGLDYKE